MSSNTVPRGVQRSDGPTAPYGRGAPADYGRTTYPIQRTQRIEDPMLYNAMMAGEAGGQLFTDETVGAGKKRVWMGVEGFFIFALFVVYFAGLALVTDESCNATPALAMMCIKDYHTSFAPFMALVVLTGTWIKSAFIK